MPAYQHPEWVVTPNEDKLTLSKGILLQNEKKKKKRKKKKGGAQVKLT